MTNNSTLHINAPFVNDLRVLVTIRLRHVGHIICTGPAPNDGSKYCT